MYDIKHMEGRIRAIKISYFQDTSFLSTLVLDIIEFLCSVGRIIIKPRVDLKWFGRSLIRPRAVQKWCGKQDH